MSHLIEFARAVLHAQPFNRLLGAELVSFEPGKAELAINMRPDLLQQHGFAHGGVVSYLADNALTFAGGSMLDNNALTGEYKINYLRPAVGERLIARAYTKYAGKQQAVTQCDIYVLKDGEEKLCATAQGTIVRV